jgi:hypothetical protein
LPPGAVLLFRYLFYKIQQPIGACLSILAELVVNLEGVAVMLGKVLMGDNRSQRFLGGLPQVKVAKKQAPPFLRRIK